MAEALKLMPGLQQIDLSMTKMGMEGTRSIAEGLREMPCLHSLRIRGSEICQGRLKGVRSLAEVLPSIPVIKLLDLNFNSISNARFAILAERLVKCRGLQHLDIYFNCCGANGACVEQCL